MINLFSFLKRKKIEPVKTSREDEIMEQLRQQWFVEHAITSNGWANFPDVRKFNFEEYLIFKSNYDLMYSQIKEASKLYKEIKGHDR